MDRFTYEVYDKNEFIKEVVVEAKTLAEADKLVMKEKEENQGALLMGYTRFTGRISGVLTRTVLENVSLDKI